MITFKTQEEFDAAVMAAVEKCLGVSVYVSEDYGNVEVEVQLNNSRTGTDFSVAKDSCTVMGREY